MEAHDEINNKRDVEIEKDKKINNKREREKSSEKR